MMRAALLCMSLAFICLGCGAIAADTEPVEPKRLSGKLIAVVSDDFEDGGADTHYALLKDGDGEIVPLDIPDQVRIPDLHSGLRVKIVGRPKNGHIHVESLHVLSEPRK